MIVHQVHDITDVTEMVVVLEGSGNPVDEHKIVSVRLYDKKGLVKSIGLSPREEALANDSYVVRRAF